MRNRLRCERGQELLEFALVLPVLLLLLLGISQLALVVLAYNTIDHAVHQGARLGVIADNADYPSRIQDAVYAVTDAAGLNRADLSFTLPFKQADNKTVRVQVDYNMRLIFPIVRTGRIPLRAISQKQVEVQ